jgi:hypothetical protein
MLQFAHIGHAVNVKSKQPYIRVCRYPLDEATMAVWVSLHSLLLLALGPGLVLLLLRRSCLGPRCTMS